MVVRGLLKQIDAQAKTILDVMDKEGSTISELTDQRKP